MSSLNQHTVSENAIRKELERVLQSSIFAQSDRLSRFLRFTVEYAISGHDEGLKEYVIGTEVYDRKPPYHPSQDSIVRTEARRLRAKLKEYYESEGKDDPIFIYFRLGSYVPVFRSKDHDDHDQGSSSDTLFVEGTGVAIAVIPFLDVSGQSLSGGFARGVTDELVHELMQCEGCRVVATSAVARLDAQVSDIPALAQRLGVQIVFEGTVREEGNRIRVTASIVNADGFQLWSQRLDAQADATSLFTVQEQFASALVNRVRPQQSVIRTAKASVGPAILALYPTILKGEALLEQGTPAEIHAALTKFREVAQAAPEYARPHCGMAQCYCWLALHGAYRSADLVSLARVAAERALELDPEMIECHAALGSALALQWDWKNAKTRFEQAIELGPRAVNSRQYALLLTALGRFDEAWQHLENAQQVDPFSYLQKVACAKFFYLSRRYEEAFEHFSEPERYGPLPLEVKMYQALCHVFLNRHDDARRFALLVQRNAGAQLLLKGWIAEVLALCGDLDAATAIAEEFQLLSAATPISRLRQASLSMALKNPEEALSALAVSYDEQEAELPLLSVDPRFDPLRENPRFQEILTKVKLGISS